MTWTPERTDTARGLWLAGNTASHIAGVLGSVTKNGVLGKMHKLGLARYERPRRQPKAKVRSAVQRNRDRETVLRIQRAPHLTSAPLAKTEAWNALPGSSPIGLLDLTDKTCRWPIGERPFRFCGCAPIAGSTYCGAHHALATRVVA